MTTRLTVLPGPSGQRQSSTIDAEHVSADSLTDICGHGARSGQRRVATRAVVSDTSRKQHRKRSREGGERGGTVGGGERGGKQRERERERVSTLTQSNPSGQDVDLRKKRELLSSF